MARKVLTFSDFSGGDWGLTGPWKAPKNSFGAVNMIVTKTGALCVRPGYKNTTPTGLVNGVVWDVFSPSKGARVIAFGQADKVREFSPSVSPIGVVTTYTSSLAGTPSTSRACHYTDGDTVYLGAGSQGLYSTLGSNVNTLLTGVTPECVARYGDRLVIVDVGGQYDSIRYSDPAVYTSWPVTNVIQVGGDSIIRAIVPQRNHLAILKQIEGIYVLTGVPGVNETLRQVSKILGPGLQRATTVSLSDDLWYLPFTGHRPTKFNGSLASRLSHLVIPQADTSTTGSLAVSLPDDDSDALILHNMPLTAETSPRTLLRYNGIWTIHDIDIPDNNNAPKGDVFRINTRQDPASAVTRPTSCFVFTNGGAAGSTPTFYTWSPLLDRPGSETATTLTAPERAGDDSSTPVAGSVDFPEWHREGGAELYVRTVIVDFRTWNTGGALTNHFDLAVKCLRRYDTVGSITSTVVFDEAVATSATGGTLQRRIFNLDLEGQPTGGFQISFTNIRGLEIQRYHVVVDDAPSRW